MNPDQLSNPLADLQDIHLPDPIGFWPPAPGYWLLLVLVILLIVALGLWWHRAHLRNAYRRAALKQLTQIEQAYRQHHNNQRLASELNQTLKQVALAVYPPHTVAGLSHEDWLQFLDQQLAADQPLFDTTIGAQLITAAYAPNQNDLNSTALIKLCETWVKGHQL